MGPTELGVSNQAVAVPGWRLVGSPARHRRRWFKPGAHGTLWGNRRMSWAALVSLRPMRVATRLPGGASLFRPLRAHQVREDALSLQWLTRLDQALIASELSAHLLITRSGYTEIVVDRVEESDSNPVRSLYSLAWSLLRAAVGWEADLHDVTSHLAECIAHDHDLPSLRAIRPSLVSDATFLDYQVVLANTGDVSSRDLVRSILRSGHQSEEDFYRHFRRTVPDSHVSARTRLLLRTLLRQPEDSE
jgi:hypothetical protein